MGIESHVGYAKNAFLGEKKGNLAYRAKVDETAEGINKILNPIDDVARRKVMGDSIKLIRSLGIQVDSVESLNNTTQDPNKSQQQKENAEIVLDVLAKGAYIAMRYGENEEARADLGSGSVKKIEDRLPEPLKGLGERVRANIIDEPEISRILDELDKQRERHEKNGALGRKTLAKKIEEAYEELDALKIESKYEDQRGMVMAFLGVEAEELGGEEVGAKDKEISELTTVIKKLNTLLEPKPEVDPYDGLIVKTPDSRKDSNGMMW